MFKNSKPLAQNILVAGTGLFLLSIALVLIAAAVVAVAPLRSPLGKAVWEKITTQAEAPTVQSQDGFRDDAPDFLDEVRSVYGGDISQHPIAVDLEQRVASVVGPSGKLVDVIQYRNYVFFDFLTSDGGYVLVVYAWSGSEWEFIDLK